jgi:hypothetical protein
MNTTRKLRLFGAMIVASLLGVARMSAQPFGLWNFDSSNLVATVGTDLAYTDGGGGATAANTVFGTTTGFGIPNINGTNAVVMKFPAATNGMGYNMLTPAGNGGGSYVNQYTYILDVLYPTASGTSIRPLIRTDDAVVDGTEQYIIVDATGGIGPASPSPGGINGPVVGNLPANTWIRLGLVVTGGGTIRVYTNGVEMGNFAGNTLDGFYSLTPSGNALILASSGTNAAAGYVNSIQLRAAALNAGQMLALGGPAATGIPATIPPVPAYISSRTPGPGDTGVSLLPAINVVLNQGDTIVTSGSVKLYLDGALVASAVETPPTYTASYTVPSRLDPLSVHTLTLAWSDSVAGNNTNTWQFTVQDYQVLTLPPPFYLEDFEELAENPSGPTQLPTGWSVANLTGIGGTSYDLNNLNSKSFENWCLITKDRLYTTFSDPAYTGSDRSNMPPIVLNGVLVPSLAQGKFMYAESDQRDNSAPNGYGEYQEMYTSDISCVGKTNVFVAWNSIYEQNQDNLDCVEYSVDGGVNWLPVIYYLMYPGDGQEANPDIIYTNGPSGPVIDVGQTFYRIDNNRNFNPFVKAATNYGSYIKAPITTNLIPYIKARKNDDQLDGKRIEVVRLPAADGAATVRFRFLNTGTGSWFWGIDNLGLYEITTPVFATQPANLTVAAGTTGTFTVVVTSPTAVTYQWQHAGTNISNSGHYSGVDTPTLTISNADPNDAGAYRCKAINASGPTTSNPANLTVVTVPTVTTQPNSAVVSDGYPVAFSGVGFGGLPLTYQWRLGNTQVGTGTSYNLASAHAANAGDYTLVITNTYGAVTSRLARLSVVTVPVTNDLVVHLKFDADFNDSSGRGNNGTPIGSPSLATGKIGNAMEYTLPDGGVAQNYVTLDNPVGTHPADLRMGTSTSFSVSFWYKVPTGNRNGDPALVSNKDWDSGGNTGFAIFNSGGGLQWNYTEVNDGVSLNSRKDSGSTSPDLEDGNWHHCLVAFQRGGGGFSYVDGHLVKYVALATLNPAGGNFDPTTIDNDPATNRTRTATGAWNIGEDGSGLYTAIGGGHDGPGINVTNAMVDDLGIWRRALSAQEALAIYSAGNAGLDLSQVAQQGSAGILSVSYSGGNAHFSWVGETGLKLQKALSLTPVITWSDVAGTTGASSYSEPATNSTAYWRLKKP